MNREVAVILALGALAVAAMVVSIGSWMLLWTERRDRRAVKRMKDPEAGDPTRKPSA